MSGKTNGDLADRDTNGRFQSGNRVNPNGRPKGSKNKATQVREELLGPILPEAVEKLHKAVKAGERWAVETVISYCLAKPKPVDSEELEEFEQRLAELEQVAGRNH